MVQTSNSLLAVNFPATNTFIKQLETASQMQFTGRLELQVNSKQTRQLFYYTGRLVWATGGPHRLRRWHRYLSWFCPDVDIKSLQPAEQSTLKEWEYWILKVLVKQQKITREQAIAVIETSLTETIFDIFQDAQLGDVHYRADQQEGLKSPLAAISQHQVLDRAGQIFKAWCGLGLIHQSPDLAPVVKTPEELRQRTSAKTFQLITQVMNGNSTLRDLAVITRQGLITFTQSLLPYLNKGLIELVEIPDLVSPSIPPPAVKSQAKPPRPKIMCVDDSIRVCQTVGEILTQAGYQFASVQDSLQALPMLLEHKPDLILLDLVMPVASGYEICSQIRKISIFKQTPVVILTGNDGIVDRVRAKMVGASDFLAKPVDAAKLLSAVRKHMAVNLDDKPVRQDVDVKSQLG